MKISKSGLQSLNPDAITFPKVPQNGGVTIIYDQALLLAVSVDVLSSMGVLSAGDQLNQKYIIVLARKLLQCLKYLSEQSKNISKTYFYCLFYLSM